MPAHAAQSNNSHTSTPPSDAAIAAVSARRSAFRTRRESAPPRFRRYDWRWPPKILAHMERCCLSRAGASKQSACRRESYAAAGDLPPRSHIGMIASESVVPRSAAKRAGGRFVCFGTYLTCARLTLIRERGGVLEDDDEGINESLHSLSRFAMIFQPQPAPPPP